jgi:hypothetical protein
VEASNTGAIPRFYDKDSQNKRKKKKESALSSPFERLLPYQLPNDKFSAGGSGSGQAQEELVHVHARMNDHWRFTKWHAQLCQSTMIRSPNLRHDVASRDFNTSYDGHQSVRSSVRHYLSVTTLIRYIDIRQNVKRTNA